MQTSCLRLMGKKLLVALTMEGKFAGEGLQSIDEDDDVLWAMARKQTLLNPSKGNAFRNSPNCCSSKAAGQRG